MKLSFERFNVSHSGLLHKAFRLFDALDVILLVWMTDGRNTKIDHPVIQCYNLRHSFQISQTVMPLGHFGRALQQLGVTRRSPIAIAASGGADSTALLCLAADWAQSGERRANTIA